MTRANGHPVRRVVSGQDFGDLVVSVTLDELSIRPKGKRRGVVSIPWSAVYLRAVQAQVDADRRERQKSKRRRVTRGTRL